MVLALVNFSFPSSSKKHDSPVPLQGYKIMPYTNNTGGTVPSSLVNIQPWNMIVALRSFKRRSNESSIRQQMREELDPSVIHRFECGKIGGSGVIVGPRHVLTAFHCIEDGIIHENAFDHYCIIGLRGKTADNIYNCTRLIRIHRLCPLNSAREYIAMHGLDDIAMVILDTDVPANCARATIAPTGNNLEENFSPPVRLPHLFNISGYPHSANLEMWSTRTTGPSQFWLSESVFWWDANEGGPGASGGPIWREEKVGSRIAYNLYGVVHGPSGLENIQTTLLGGSSLTPFQRRLLNTYPSSRCRRFIQTGFKCGAIITQEHNNEIQRIITGS